MLHHIDQLFQPDETAGLAVHRHVRALVVGAVVGYFFGAGAQAGHRHDYPDAQAVLPVFALADEGDVIIHETLHAGDGCFLRDEIRESHLDVAGERTQPLGHVSQHLLE